MTESALEEFLAGETDGAGAYTPALPTVRAQQQDLRDRLRDGFADRREILLWQHAVATVSAGQVDDDWHRKILSDRWRTAALLSDPAARDRMAEHPPTAEHARSERQDIVQEDLIPAFRSALGQIRKWAGDYTDTAEGINGTDRQRFIGMRPRLHQLAVVQHRVLRRALDEADDHPPIQSREDVLEWVDAVVFATSGLVSDTFVRDVTAPLGEWWRPLTQDRGTVLELLLVSDVLPPMNRALRDAAERAEEAAMEWDNSPDVDPGPTEAY